MSENKGVFFWGVLAGAAAAAIAGAVVLSMSFRSSNAGGVPGKPVAKRARRPKAGAPRRKAGK